MAYIIKFILAMYFIFFNLDASVFNKKKMVSGISNLAVFTFNMP